jgi:pyridinium-3,5-bisthiocarboxylic acid mononucleotide nickel chelatase
MRIAYLDCFSGISGDMCLAALIDAGASLPALQAAIASLQLGVELGVAPTKKHAFRGLSLQINHPSEHAHRNLQDIHQLILHGKLSAGAREMSLRLFECIARVEAKVHGTTIDRVHFHEVGAIDSIVDLVGTAIAWDELGIERAVASPVPTGTGKVRIAHGTVSIPAPATAELLKNIPIAACSIPMEMTTPTGAAILSELVQDYGPLPPMQVGRIGYGAGTRDLDDRPNLLRILIGEAMRPRPPRRADDAVVVLETNLDDTTGEQIGFAIEQLWRAGALDVFSTPIYMKKGRPATLLTVIAKPEDRSGMERLLFTHTGTLGVRWRRQSRTILTRAQVDVQTHWGFVAGKVSRLPDGTIEFSPEYEACRAIALEEELRLVDVMDEVRACYHTEEPLPPSGESDTVESKGSASLGSVESKVNPARTFEDNDESYLDPIAVDAMRIHDGHPDAIRASDTVKTAESESSARLASPVNGIAEPLASIPIPNPNSLTWETSESGESPPNPSIWLEVDPHNKDPIDPASPCDADLEINARTDEEDRDDSWYRWDSYPWNGT